MATSDVELNFSSESRTASEDSSELNLTEPEQAQSELPTIADNNSTSSDLGLSAELSASTSTTEANLSLGLTAEDNSTATNISQATESDPTDIEDDLNQSQTPALESKEPPPQQDVVLEKEVLVQPIENDEPIDLVLPKEDNATDFRFSILEKAPYPPAPEEGSVDTDVEAQPIPPPQPLVSEVEELLLQRDIAAEVEIQVQSMGAPAVALELVQEDRALDPPILIEEDQNSSVATDPVNIEPEPPEDDGYHQQIALLLEAELAFQEGRYAESFALRIDVARSSGDAQITQEAYNSASFARDGEAMNEALDLWLQQAPNDQTAHRLRLVQLLQSYQPLQALRSLEQLYFLGAEVDFSLPVSILVYPTEQQARTMIDAYSQMALQYDERADIWSAILLLRIYLANILSLQQRHGEAQAELQTIRSQRGGWELIPRETLHALDLQEALVNAEILSDREIESWYERAILRSPTNWKLRLQHLELAPDPNGLARVLAVELMTEGDNAGLMALHSVARDLDINSTVATIDYYHSERARINNEQALQNLAKIAENDGQLVLADEYLARLYANPDARLSAYLSRLRLWLSNDQPDIAREIYRSSWQDQQLNQVEASIIYARALNEFKLYDQSLRLLTILLQQSEQQSQVLLLLVRAEVYMFRGDYALMEADLRKVIADAPSESSAYNTLGYVLADINVRLDEAERLIDQALQIDPENAGYVDSLGWLAFRQGDFERARQLIEWAYGRWQYPDIIAHLGEIYWSLGEPERALYLWLDALKNDGDHELLTSTIARVTAAEEGVDLYQHLVARLQAITSGSER